jgi:hypothetical protein
VAADAVEAEVGVDFIPVDGVAQDDGADPSAASASLRRSSTQGDPLESATTRRGCGIDSWDQRGTTRRGRRAATCADGTSCTVFLGC